MVYHVMCLHYNNPVTAEKCLSDNFFFFFFQTIVHDLCIINDHNLYRRIAEDFFTEGFLQKIMCLYGDE